MRQEVGFFNYLQPVLQPWDHIAAFPLKDHWPVSHYTPVWTYWFRSCHSLRRGRGNEIGAGNKKKEDGMWWGVKVNETVKGRIEMATE